MHVAVNANAILTRVLNWSALNKAATVLDDWMLHAMILLPKEKALPFALGAQGCRDPKIRMWQNLAGHMPRQVSMLCLSMQRCRAVSAGKLWRCQRSEIRVGTASLSPASLSRPSRGLYSSERLHKSPDLYIKHAISLPCHGRTYEAIQYSTAASRVRIHHGQGRVTDHGY